MAYSLWNYWKTELDMPRSDLYLNIKDRRGHSASFPIGDNMQNGNTLAVGTARTGKTVFLRNMAAKLREAYPNALFVFMDVKQDYINDRRLFRAHDYVVSYYAMHGCFRQFQWSWIEEALCSREPYAEIKEIDEILFESLPEQGQNQIFVESAKLAFCAFLNAFVDHLLKGAKPFTQEDVPPNAEVIALYNRMNFQDKRRWIKSVPSQAVLCDETLPADKNGNPTKYAESVLSIIRVFISMFEGNFCGNGRDSLCGFLGMDGSAMFLEFDYSKQRSSSALFRLFLKRLIQQKMALTSPYRHKKLDLFQDESAVLRGDADLVNALNIGAGDGIRIILACQSIDHLYMQAPSQLNEHFGKAMMAGFSNVICFRPSDSNTINAVQEKFGKADIEKMTMPADRYQAADVFSVNDYIVSSEQLTSLGLGDAYAKLKDGTPIKVHFEED